MYKRILIEAKCPSNPAASFSFRSPTVPRVGEVIEGGGRYRVVEVCWHLYPESAKGFDSYTHPDSEFVTLELQQEEGG